MRKAIAIYHAPKDDSKVVEMCGVTFFDNHPVELNSGEHAHLFLKLPTNSLFEIEIGEEEAAVQKRGPGRPRKEEAAD